MVYNAVHICVRIQKFRSAFLVRAAPSWHMYYFLPLLSHGSMCKNYRRHLFRILCAKVSAAPALTWPL